MVYRGPPAGGEGARVIKLKLIANWQLNIGSHEMHVVRSLLTRISFRVYNSDNLWNSFQ